MQTPMQELLALIPDAREIKEYISEFQPDEKMLDEWLWERMFKGRNWIVKEEEMAIGLITGFIYSKKTMTPREYFNQRYNQNNEETKKVCENKVNGVCPLHNLFCKYPDCES